MKLSEDFRNLARTWVFCFLILAVLIYNIPSSTAAPIKQSEGPIPNVTIQISSGATGGAYFNFSNQSKNLCDDVVKVAVAPSTGGPANLDALDSNTAHIAPIQLDSLAMASQGRDVSGLRVLFPMFPETVMFIVRSEPIPEPNCKVFCGKKTLNTLADLKGLSVAAAGGAIDTGLHVNNMTSAGYRLVALPSSQNGKNAVQSVLDGKVEAAIVTGAHPVKWLKEMPEALKLKLKFLSIPDAMMASLEKVYGKTKVSYPGFGGQPLPVQTITVKSVMMTQNYRKGEIVKALSAYRQCVEERAEEYSATPGAEPAWRYIKPGASTTGFQTWSPAGN